VVDFTDFNFIGTYEHAVDAKGRLAVPTQFRRKLQAVMAHGLVLARGPNRCIELYTRDAWVAHVRETTGEMSLYDPQARRLRRAKLGNAWEVEMDEQGRVLIPQQLREMSGISSAAVVTGIGSFIEIWDPARYREYSGEADENYDKDLVEMDRLKRSAAGQPGSEPGPRGDVSPAGDGR
jgi:MraZ protein